MAELCTCRQVADRYKVEVLTVWDWIRKKKLAAVKIGRTYLIKEEDLKAFEDARKTIS